MCVSHIVTLIVCFWVKPRDWVKRLFGLKRKEVMEGRKAVYKEFLLLNSLYIAVHPKCNILLSEPCVVHCHINSATDSCHEPVGSIPHAHILFPYDLYYPKTEGKVNGCAKYDLDWFGVRIWWGKDGTKAGEYIEAGLILCQGYIPEKRVDQNHANRTPNSHLTQCISWGLGD